jgi:hypothetical protein
MISVIFIKMICAFYGSSREPIASLGPVNRLSYENLASML